MSFVHLHTHSEYSLLDGANRISDLVDRACRFEQPALALTDHGVMYGARSFYRTAKDAGIKPILGMEAYVAPGDRRERTKVKGADGERAYYHLVVLARDRRGYENLTKLSSIGFTEGFYHKPRVDREVLAEHSGGLVVSSACLAGEIARKLLAGDREGARETATWYAETFPDRYYLEVQAHDTPGQAELNRKVLDLADELGLPVIATNDAHFLRPEDHEAHDVLLCIGLGKDRDDPNRLRYDEGLYFKSHEEIAERFPEHPEVLENTLRIADEVDFAFRKQYHLPSFPLPGEYDDDNDYLVALTRDGARERYGEPLPDEVEERLGYELEVITKTGYAGYFLIVQDFINWAKENGVPVGPGRGSAAGSLVAYSLGITDVDPLRFDLLFERFLNPERISMPDIDIDFCYERRGEVIEHVREKYGWDSVGHIITFGTMKSRAVIRDVGRTLGFEPSETDRLAKMIPNQPGNSYTVEEAVQRIPDVRKEYERGDEYEQLFEYAMTLEGLSRHASVHAAGIVIAPGPLDEYVPVCTQQSGGSRERDEDAIVVTQYDMTDLEKVGMLKMDFLGLKTLTVIHDAVEAVERRVGALRHPETGEEYGGAEEIPLDDPAVYEMLSRGGTSGVFQFESTLATDKLKAMRCDRFDDLIATNALIRPGPLDSGMTDVYIRRKLGQEEVRYPHPRLEPVLEDTHGVIVYQEQVMRIANVLAGFSLAEADVLRKAVGKKDQELIERELRRFVDRCMENGVDRRTAEDIASQIETFGRYGFNKSHSTAYALLSYQTAWLKCHYPSEFMAALLSSVIDSTDDVVKYIGECREMGRYLPNHDRGVEVLPPDVNESGLKFTSTDDHTIRFGLGAIRGIGSSGVSSILEAREEEGRFSRLFEFLDRIDLRANNKRSIDALIASGALDAFGHRARLHDGLERMYGEVQLRQEERDRGQASLFGALGDEDGSRPEPELPEAPRWTETERLAREKEALGFYISGHPLDRHREIVRAFRGVNARNLADHAGRQVELPCVVTQVSRQVSRKDGSEWGKVTVEDFHGTASVLAFREAWEENRDLLEPDACILVEGMVSGRERDEADPPIFLDEVRPLDEVGTGGELAVLIEVDSGSSLPDDAFSTARTVAEHHPGASPLYVALNGGNGAGGGEGRGVRARFRSRSLTLSPEPETLEELRKVFGAGRVRLVRA